MNTKKKFSIVIPVYFNEENIPHTVPKLQEVANGLINYDVEFLFIDDGSKDSSAELILEAQKSDKRIKLIKLSKNFGSMAAILAGYDAAEGDCIGIIAADLQDPPELFVEMISAWEKGIKVVLAVRQKRDDPIMTKFFSNVFYILMNRFAISGYPKGGFDFVLIDRQVKNELSGIKEKNTNIMSLIFWLGYNQLVIPYTRGKREHGTSMWTMSKKIKLFIDSFINFSFAPIRLMSFVGLSVASLSFIYAIVSIVNYFSGNIPIEGWTTLVVLVSMMSGIIMIMLGIIGEYLWRILDESRKRPPYIIDEIYVDSKDTE